MAQRLGRQRRGWIQILNFAVAGALLLVFVRALRHQLPPRRSSRVAAGLMTVMTVAIIASAAPTDRDFTHRTECLARLDARHRVPRHRGVQHCHPLMTARTLRGEDRWRPLARVSAAAAGICAVGVFLTVVSQIGFYLFLLTVFGWYATLAIRFLRLTTG